MQKKDASRDCDWRPFVAGYEPKRGLEEVLARRVPGAVLAPLLLCLALLHLGIVEQLEEVCQRCAAAQGIASLGLEGNYRQLRCCVFFFHIVSVFICFHNSLAHRRRCQGGR